MYYVYVIQSRNSTFRYIGSTKDIHRRFNEHNEGLSHATKAHRPYTLQLYVAVRTRRKAVELERYFKTGSGSAVLNKHFLN